LAIVVKFVIPAGSLGVEILYSFLILISFMALTPLLSLLTPREIKALQNQIQLFLRNTLGRVKAQK
jgi:hypothetical protein